MKHKRIEIGDNYHELKVLDRLHKNKWGQTYFKCQCSCGKETVVLDTKLKSGHTKACGDYQAHWSKHGHASKKGRTHEHNAWSDMKARCLKPQTKNFHHYGGRGIKIYEPWINSFQSFLDYIGLRPSDDHSLNRINNDGNYEPGNVEWADGIVQSNNKRDNIHVEIAGERITYSQAARKYGIHRSVIRERHLRGLSNYELVKRELI